MKFNILNNIGSEVVESVFVRFENHFISCRGYIYTVNYFHYILLQLKCRVDY